MVKSWLGGMRVDNGVPGLASASMSPVLSSAYATHEHSDLDEDRRSRSWPYAASLTNSG